MTDLDRLKELLAKATPGPVRVSNHRQSSIAIQTIKNDHEIASVPRQKYTDNKRCEADAALIVEAVNTLPALISDVETLVGEVERLREALIGIEEYWNREPSDGAMLDALDVITYRARKALGGDHD